MQTASLSLLACVVSMTLAAPAGRASVDPLSESGLAAALQHGGYVLVMRHASSPPAPPSAVDADPGNPDRERQLDAAGKAAATAMGEAIRKLHLRIGRVWSSPTYRALETARLAGLPKPATAAELGDHGQSMSAATGQQSDWLRAKAGEAPRPGTDSILITHQPNIAAAFGDAAQGLADGEALVLRPEGGGKSELVARIPMADWPKLAGG